MSLRQFATLLCVTLLSFSTLAADAPANTDAVIKKIDAVKQQITLQHGPIDTINMPAMTMAFDVVDSKLLAGLKPGDKLKVRIEDRSGRYVVVRILPQR